MIKKRTGIIAYMKKILLMFIAFVICPLWAFGEGSAEDKASDERTLVVASTTAMQGDFFNGMFGNSSSDYDVRALIHGYNLVNWDNSQGIYTMNKTVVQDVMALDNDAGDRTYYIIINDDLKYSDGSEITSWDYAFSILLSLNPVMAEIGGDTTKTRYIYGSEAYRKGETEYLSGVHVISDKQLSITIDHSYLPYFQETALLLFEPYPVRFVAPGCTIYDDGEGAYIGSIEETDEEPFTKDLLKTYFLDAENGYLSHPAVSSGPYVLTSYDGATAEFEVNPYYKGDANGRKGTISRIKYIVIRAEDASKKLASGEVNLVNKLVNKNAIKACEKEKLETESYGRTGLTMIAFSTEKPTVSEVAVRQAIAWCMDRDSLTNAYCGENGIRVDGCFGKGQWEYLLATQKINVAGELEEVNNSHKDKEKTSSQVWKTLNLNNLTEYHVDTIKANALLDKAGWTLDSNGEPFKNGKNKIRHKNINGRLIALDLTLMYPEGNHIIDTIQKDFINNLNRCGINLTLVAKPMTEVMASWHRVIERETDMVYMGTNFDIVGDFSADLSIISVPDLEDYTDNDLYWRAVSIRQTDPMAIYEYMTKWVAFQERFNEVLPALPVYSSDYRDFWCKDLKGYNISEHKTWAQAILGAEF